MSERIELTRGAPDRAGGLEYSGSSPQEALDVLHHGIQWYGLVKIWTDDEALLQEFLKLIDSNHPAGLKAVTAVHRVRYAQRAVR